MGLSIKNIKYYISNILDFIRQNKRLLYIIGFFAILAYGYEITNWSMSIDEEVYLYVGRGTLPLAFISEGRWGIAIISLILPLNSPQPFWEMLLTVIILMLASIVLVYDYDLIIENIIGLFVSASIFLTMPIHSFWEMFQTYSVAIALGYLFIFLSVGLIIFYFEKNRKLEYLIVAVLLGAFSIGIYQAFAVTYIEVTIGYFMLKFISLEQDLCSYKFFLKRMSFFIVALMSMMIVYYIVNKLFQFIRSDNGYVDSFILWGKLSTQEILDRLLPVLKNIYIYPEKMFTGGWMLKCAYIICILNTMIYAFTFKRRFCIFFILNILNTVSVSGLVILIGHYSPMRTLSAVASYCALNFYVMLVLIERYHYISYIICGISIILCLNQIRDINALFFSEHSRSSYDYMIATQLCGDLEKYVVNNNISDDYKLAIIGARKEEKNHFIKEDSFSNSYFRMAQNRVYFYLESLGKIYSQPNNSEEWSVAENKAKEMTVWPKDGSISYKDGMIIVKLGEVEQIY